MNTIWKILTRRKILDPITIEQTQLRRVLNWLDLTALGVGSTLGVGVYVLAGHVAKDTAGPAVVLSFLIAAIASVFAGLCYAEFGARTPKAGSAYIYSYVCVGEFIAFIIGWNLILEYVIGSASVARGLSLYLDTLLNNTLQNTFIDIAPINIKFMSAYFDFFAFGVSFLLAVALAFGMKESSLVNNIFTLLNLGVVVFVIIAGSIKADPANWQIKPTNTSNRDIIGAGGFFPFGIEGMIKGAATCFYGFVGFDCIATTGEEVKNPQKAIPISIILSLFIIFLSYFGTSTVITLMVPYYLQDPNAPIPHAFDMVDWEIPKWIVAIGGIFGLCASLFGAMFPLPRIIYAMASDGLVFRFLGKVHARFQTPVIGTLLAGTLTGLMGALFDLKQLVNMMSIGTLLAYTIVAASVLLLRYERNSDDILFNESIESSTESLDNETYEENTNETSELIQQNVSNSSLTKQLFNLERTQEPTIISQRIVSIGISIYSILCIFIGLCAIYLKTSLSNGEIWSIILTSIILCLMILIIMSIATQPQSRRQLSFKVPLIPLIPALSILVNIYLMLMLDSHTWIRFGVWMLIGLPTYYFSVRNHKETRNMSLSSITQNLTNGKLNGIDNSAYVNDNDKIDYKDIVPTSQLTEERIESTIAVLDEILEEASKSITPPPTPTMNQSNNENPINNPDLISPIDNNTNTTIIIHSNPNDDIKDNLNIEPEEILETAEIADDNNNNNQTEPEIELKSEILSLEWQTTETEIVDLVSLKTVKITTTPQRPTVSDISSVKLRKVPKTLPVDFSRENSIDNIDNNNKNNNNLKLSTPEFRTFKEKLEKSLQVLARPISYFVPVVDKKVAIKKPPLKHNEDVIEENINATDAKQKLSAFLQRSQSTRHNDDEDDDNKENINKIDIPRTVIDTLNRINLRKIDNFKSDSNKGVDDEIEVASNHSELNNETEHRIKMTDTLNSIKLRKVDSFKNDDNEKIDKIEERINDSNLINDETEHKIKMTDTLNSIKLRKIDSFKSEINTLE